MSVAERVMKFTFSGAKSGSFSAAGLRAAVSLSSLPGRIGTPGSARIWGLSLAQMNAYSSRLASVPQGIGVEPFNVIIEAGDMGQPLIEVLNGPIFSSSIDLSGAPDSAFNVTMIDTFVASNPIASQSQPNLSAQTRIATICAAAGLTFENIAGASAPQNNHTTYGSAIDQIARIATAAKFNWKISGKTVSIWPQKGSVDDVIIDLGPDTEPKMVGYPAFSDVSLVVTSLFNPAIKIGRRVNVISSLPNAAGLWQVTEVQHDLTTMLPKGPWFTTARMISAT